MQSTIPLVRAQEQTMRLQPRSQQSNPGEEEATTETLAAQGQPFP